MRVSKKLLVAACLLLVMILGIPIVQPVSLQTMPVEAAAKVKLNKKKATIYVGKSVQLKIKGTKSKVKWTSNKKSVAKVNFKGKVTGKKAGKAVITAKVDKKKYKCTVTVQNNVSKPQTIEATSITLSQSVIQLNEGQTAKITAKVFPDNATNKVVLWSSSDMKIATVNNGVIRGIKAGIAIITAKIGNIKQLCVVTVKIPVIQIKDLVVDKEYKVRMGNKKTINVSYLPLNANEKFVPVFTSSDTSVVTVSKTGELTPVKIGKTSVEVKYEKIRKIINIIVLESKEELLKNENERYEAELKELYDTYSQYLNMVDVEIEAVRESYGYYYGTEYEYQTELEDLNNQISTIQKRIAAYSGDSSQEAKAIVQKLKASLSSYESELKELERRWSGKTRIDSLDELADSYVEEYNESIEIAKNKHTEIINDINADIE